ncbi:MULTISPECIES: ATP-dependent DNA ligase [Salinibaculum]|uniref:ATP-dependent DNA ligase n=1 Tax=Salinibaculum TaxID=2732368 RepID=UPI0030D1E89D
MDYAALVAVYDRLASTQSTTEKTAILAEQLAETPQEDLPMLVRLLRGQVFAAWHSADLGVSSSLASRAVAKATGLSEDDIESDWRETGDLGDAAARAVEKQVQQSLFSDPLTVERVYDTLQSLADLDGAGSESRRVDEVAGLLSDADPDEARYVVRTALGHLRLGIGEGTVRDAIAEAFLDEPDSEAVERALQVTNDAGVVAQTAASEGRDGLDDLELAVHRPVKVMLAEKSDSIADALADAGGGGEETDDAGSDADAPDDGTVSLDAFADDGDADAGAHEGTAPLVEYKVDGFRAQVHATPEETRVFTRRLEDVTHQFPDVVAAVEDAFDADSFVLEGEVLGYDPETERPVPFQQLSRRIKRKYDVEQLAAEVPVVLYAFDLLAVDGETLLEATLSDRVAELEARLEPEDLAVERMPNRTTADADEAAAFYEDALAAGHEGVMVKNPTATYQPGKRVGYMLKVKPTMEPLDLTITRAKWSEGRRSNNLGRLYLGCRDPETDEFRDIGRLSTGFSDEQLADLTERLEDAIVAEDGRAVDLEPREVIEVAYEEIQASPEYDSGYALRFPRFEGFRDDVGLDEVDSLERVERLYEDQ